MFLSSAILLEFFNLFTVPVYLSRLNQCRCHGPWRLNTLERLEPHRPPPTLLLLPVLLIRQSLHRPCRSMTSANSCFLRHNERCQPQIVGRLKLCGIEDNVSQHFDNNVDNIPNDINKEHSGLLENALQHLHDTVVNQDVSHTQELMSKIIIMKNVLLTLKKRRNLKIV